MGSYLFHRLLTSVPVLFGITLIVFIIMSLIPGDPATAILGSYATPENVQKLNQELGLDKSLIEQYAIWMSNLLQGDLGRSYSLNRPVIDEVLERFSATLILAGTSFVICSGIGVLVGVISAIFQFSLIDRLTTFFVLLGISIPSFFSE